MALPLLTLMVTGPNPTRGDLNCVRPSAIVGSALPFRPGSPRDPIDVARAIRVQEFARICSVKGKTWAQVGDRLRREAEAALGPLSEYDRYWLGTSWWAFHQPLTHIHYPRWAERCRIDPDLPLRHPEGGNCESSAIGHAMLLQYLGIPSRPVYGRLMPEDEGHVWTVSDVDGRPFLADVHLARATQAERSGREPWKPTTAQVMKRADYHSAKRFGAFHTPEQSELSGLKN